MSRGESEISLVPDKSGSRDISHSMVKLRRSQMTTQYSITPHISGQFRVIPCRTASAGRGGELILRKEKL